MKSDDREMLHKYLDGELTGEEREAFLRRLKADAGLKKEFDGLSAALRMVAGSPAPPVPSGFTRQVMQRLPQHTPSLAGRIRRFLFADRTLRWNMATAVAAAMALVVGTLVISRQVPSPAERAAFRSDGQESAVTVRLNLYAPEAQTVSVAGDFNRWQVDADRMSREADGVWTVEIKLKPGNYNYMFVVNGKAWITDPDAESYQDDGFGSKNAVMRVRT